MAGITNLTNTKWKLKADPDVSTEFEYDINFVSKENEYAVFKAYAAILDDTTYNLMYGTTTTVYSIEDGESSGAWSNDGYKTIIITGGDDADDTDLIAWFEANAELIVYDNLFDISVNFGERIYGTGVFLRQGDMGINAFRVTVTGVDHLPAYCDTVKIVYKRANRPATEKYDCEFYYPAGESLTNKVLTEVPDEVVNLNGHYIAELHLYKDNKRKATARFAFIVQPDISNHKRHEAIR